MGDIAIRVQGLSKKYRIGKHERYLALRDKLTDAIYAPFRRINGLIRGNAAAASNLEETIWALNDLTFEVKRGDAIGIIGRNGAGKSTLLKILSRITEPTEGQVEIFGRVGALLEVGTGFHPELTGRENIALNGAILGMSREEIRRKFDDIVAFAEVDKFIDTPVKHYSSGMGLRLGFAVAAHMEPEILIVDEVLAVGDATFQKKCLGKMTEVIGRGRTVLFVSHNMAAIQSLCQTAIHIDGGRIAQIGKSRDVIARYLRPSSDFVKERLWEDVVSAIGNESVKIRRIAVYPSVSAPIETTFTMTTPITLEVEYWNLVPNAKLSLSLNLYDSQGVLILNSAPVHDIEWLGKPFHKGLFSTKCIIPGYLLNSGVIRIEILVVQDQSHIVYRISDAIQMDIQESIEVRGLSTWYGKWEGVVHPKLEWETRLLNINL